MENMCGKAKKRGTIYICCPSNYASGGPEALHQLCYYMNKSGIDAKMLYVNVKTSEAITPARYRKYLADDNRGGILEKRI